MNKYREALDVLKNFCTGNGASCEEETLQNAIKTLEELIDVKNEMCSLCGKYKQEHLGACKGCKYENQ